MKAGTLEVSRCQILVQTNGKASRLVLNIRRSLLLIDALKEAKKEKFDVKKFVKVQA